MKTLIANGQLLDGLGHAPIRADLLIDGDRILDIGLFPHVTADRRIDAAGMLVTPGFMDIHRHPDAAILSETFGPGELAQGITSIVGGNCGLSPLPMNPRYEKECRAFLAPCLGTEKVPAFDSLDAYLRFIEDRGTPVNLGMLAAAGAIKIWAKGFGNSPFTNREMDRVQAILRTLLEEGALGISTGIMYAPECYTAPDEYIRWFRTAAPFGRPLCCHIRGEGNSLPASVQEVIHIGQAAGLPVHISHFKSTGIRNWGILIHQAIDLIEKARASGQDVTADFYPYDAGASTLLSLVPPETQSLGQQALCAKAGTKEIKEKMKRALYHSPPGWDNMALDIGWKRILLTGGKGAEMFAGMDFEEIARRMGVDDPCDALCEIMAITGGQAGVVLQSMSDADIKTVARLPYTFLISDGLYGDGASHPRQKGAFPHFLKHFVPDVLSLPEAIRKMTSMPADRLGIRNRGRLSKGCFADAAVFNLDQLEDRATFASPHLPAKGICRLLLNGETVWADEKPAGAFAGRTLRAVPKQ